MTASVDELVAQLDDRDERWDLYRRHDHQWIVSMGRGAGDPAARTVSGATIGEALSAAVASVRLPVVPQPPWPLGELSVGKEGTSWLVYENRSVVTRTKTRREALACIERVRERHGAAWASWDAEYRQQVVTGVEGVDFYWANP